MIVNEACIAEQGLSNEQQHSTSGNLGSAHLQPKKNEFKLTDQTNLLPFKKVIVIFMGLSLCIVISVLDSVIVATALPTISTKFHAGSTSAWVPSAYLLTSTGFQPLYGRFSDIFGRKLTLCLSMGIYIIGGFASGFSQSIQELVVFRGVAGVGGGAITTMAQVVISDIVSLRDRGKYQGIIGGVIALGYAIGPLIGGALAQKVSWRWCFWITLPVALLAIVVIAFFLPLKSVSGDVKRKLMAIDYIGSVLTLTACTLILLPLIWGGITFSWTSSPVLTTLITGILIGIIFCVWEWKGAKLPIVPMHIFRQSTVSGVNIAVFVNGFIFWSSLFYLSQFFQVALGYTPIHSGIFLLPVLGLLVSRTGRFRAIIYSGFTVWSLACGLISTLNETTKSSVMVVYMLLAGVGAGQTLQTTTIAAQASVSRRDMSIVTAVKNFVKLMGGTLTLPVGAAIINNSLRAVMDNLNLSSELINSIVNDPTILASNSSAAQTLGSAVRKQILAGYMEGFRSLFILNAVSSALAAVAGVLLIKHHELTRPDEAQLREEARMSEEEKVTGAQGVIIKENSHVWNKMMKP